MLNDKIEIKHSKALKLTNVLIIKVDLEESEGLEKEIFKMENYIKNKGAQPVGPLIQYASVENDGINEPQFVIKLLRQSSTFIHSTDQPYKMESILRVPNCMYARYKGEESKLKLAYDKMNVVAFEEDIQLKGDSYTVFVSSSEDGLIADVFMEREGDE